MSNVNMCRRRLVCSVKDYMCYGKRVFVVGGECVYAVKGIYALWKANMIVQQKASIVHKRRLFVMEGNLCHRRHIWCTRLRQIWGSIDYVANVVIRIFFLQFLV